MTKYLVIYDLQEEYLKSIPRKIAEILVGECLDTKLPLDQKKDYSDFESLVIINDRNRSGVENFLSRMNIQGKDIDIITITKNNGGFETLEKYILAAGGKLFSKNILSINEKTETQILKDAEEIAYRIFKL